ncbi:Basic proline-rich protein precursor [Janthinobacterium sp. CG23_2]|nr:Basic proline-rich protein precursor [Janthinobacterium sp. CG23_2]CUU33162.1 Basic proline-rich protein precursor [Janthinobacterium sp. CG23_2]
MARAPGARPARGGGDCRRRGHGFRHPPDQRFRLQRILGRRQEPVGPGRHPGVGARKRLRRVDLSAPGPASFGGGGVARPDPERRRARRPGQPQDHRPGCLSRRFRLARPARRHRWREHDRHAGRRRHLPLAGGHELAQDPARRHRAAARGHLRLQPARGRRPAAGAPRPAHRRDGHRRGPVALRQGRHALAHRPAPARRRRPRQLRARAGAPARTRFSRPLQRRPAQRRRRRKPQPGHEPRLPGQSHRAGPGGSVHRRLPGVFDPGAVGDPAPQPVRAAARARRRTRPAAAPGDARRRQPGCRRRAGRHRRRLCTGRHRPAFFRRRPRCRLLYRGAPGGAVHPRGGHGLLCAGPWCRLARLHGARLRSVARGARRGPQIGHRRSRAGAPGARVAIGAVHRAGRRAGLGAARVRAASVRLCRHRPAADRRHRPDAAPGRLPFRPGQPQWRCGAACAIRCWR